MSTLNPAKLHVTHLGAVTAPPAPRRYTLTHSDRTGDLVLSIGRKYDRAAIAGLHTRPMRDIVHFHARQPQFHKSERWGVLADYRLENHHDA